MGFNLISANIINVKFSFNFGIAKALLQCTARQYLKNFIKNEHDLVNNLTREICHLRHIL